MIYQHISRLEKTFTENKMPYALKKMGHRYEVITKATGKGHGLTTKPKAEAQMRILEGVFKKTGR